MRKTYHHKVNEGVNIRLNEFSLDIIVVAIGKGEKYREACLEILSSNGSEKICLSPSEKLVSLGHNIYLGIHRVKKPNRKSAQEILREIYYERDDDKVSILYDFPKGTIIESKRYD